MEYHLAIKNKILPFAIVWMVLKVIMLSEISQLEKDKCHMISLIGGIEIKTYTNKEKNPTSS